MVETGTIGIAFETVRVGRGLPLLRPMSEIAGRMAVQEGTRFLSKVQGGKGILLQGVPGVQPGHVVIIGAGVAGTAAATAAVGLGARVTMIDVNLDALTELSHIFGGKIETLYSNKFNIASAIKAADLVVSTVLIPGAKAPKLVTKEMIKDMPDGGVSVDVAIDKGGTTEYTEGRPTSHDNPVFVEEGVLHYSVANIPGAVAQTSTYALCNATAKYVKVIAKFGVKEAVAKFPELVPGVNVANGKVTFKAVADDLGYEYTPVEVAL